MRKCISITNPEVIKIYENTPNQQKSKLIEDSILFYTNNKDKKFTTVEDVKMIINEYLIKNSISIENKNIISEKNDNINDMDNINENTILDILKM